MQNDIQILPAINDNKDELVKLLQAEKLPTEDLPAQLDNFFVAFDGSCIVGAAGVETYNNHGLLRSLVVDKACRNHGIGAKLLQANEHGAMKLGLESLYLLTETAKDYFERKGYALVNREDVPEAIKLSSEFSRVCPASAVVMRKKLEAAI